MRKIRKNTLWRVPAYCAICGLISYRLIVRLLGRLVLVTLPDGTITADQTRSLIL